MKKILCLVIALSAVVSCFKDSGYSWSQTIYATFEYTDAEQVFEADSMYCRTNIAWEGLVAFCNEADSINNDLYGGFALSRFLGDSLETRQSFRVYDNEKKRDINTYLVFEQSSAMPKNDFIFPFTDNGSCTMRMCYVNNTAQVVKFVRDNFQVGDKMVIKATGILDDKTKTAEFILAEKSALKDSLVTDWSVFDLSKLGAVEAVDFEILSNRDDVPKYFCLDNMIMTVAMAFE